jgi:hypothetical protein
MGGREGEMFKVTVDGTKNGFGAAGTWLAAGAVDTANQGNLSSGSEAGNDRQQPPRYPVLAKIQDIKGCR